MSSDTTLAVAVGAAPPGPDFSGAPVAAVDSAVARYYPLVELLALACAPAQ